MDAICVPWPWSSRGESEPWTNQRAPTTLPLQ
jgi:hypothetical protein